MDATTAPGSKACMWANRFAGGGLILLLVGLLGAQLGLSPLVAMLVLTLAGLFFVIGGIAGAIGLIRSRGTAAGRSPGLTWAAVILAIAAVFSFGNMMGGASGSPPIHDISTDLDNPPEFVAVAALRKSDDNPVEYTGGDTPDRQREAYPDIKTIVLLDPKSYVFEQALAVARDMGWEIVAEDATAGTIEATATTTYVGFKDDVAIRISTRSAETLVDVRSKSRIGRGDMGVNARRVREFRDKLLAAVEP
jgi:uncharacterized protein (DUF1499 family)